MSAVAQVATWTGIGLGTIVLSFIAPYVVEPDYDEVMAQYKRTPDNLIGAVRTMVSMLPVEAQLKTVSLQELVQQGTEHPLHGLVETLKLELESHFGIEYLQKPSIPAQMNPPEKRLYRACLRMQADLKDGTAEAIKLSARELGWAIHLHREAPSTKTAAPVSHER
jgi:hypothetical protein